MRQPVSATCLSSQVERAGELFGRLKEEGYSTIVLPFVEFPRRDFFFSKLNPLLFVFPIIDAE